MADQYFSPDANLKRGPRPQTDLDRWVPFLWTTRTSSGELSQLFREVKRLGMLMNDRRFLVVHHEGEEGEKGGGFRSLEGWSLRGEVVGGRGIG